MSFFFTEYFVCVPAEAGELSHDVRQPPVGGLLLGVQQARPRRRRGLRRVSLLLVILFKINKNRLCSKTCGGIDNMF